MRLIGNASPTRPLHITAKTVSTFKEVQLVQTHRGAKLHKRAT